MPEPVIPAPGFLDTNILLYSISRDPREARKRTRAIELLDDDRNALSIQVLQEFYVQATRTTRPDPITHEDAAGLIASWHRFRIQEMTLPVLKLSLDIRQAHRLSFWDSAIVAAAHTLGCDRIYSEDLNHGQLIQGVRIVNPFAQDRRRSPAH
ncbi:MAG TPA: PIN domain-containing protein [Bryobacteraceae bacterium]|nr:PIN domain-containing protein [Bryobacteraceae bacterium]